MPLERHRLANVEHGLYFRPGEFKDPAGTAIAIDALKHHLLYCHSLAIDGSLRWMLDAFVLNREHYDSYKEQQRAEVVNYLRFLEVIEPSPSVST